MKCKTHGRTSPCPICWGDRTAIDLEKAQARIKELEDGIKAHKEDCDTLKNTLELEDGIKAHKEDCDTLKNTLFNHDEIDSELHKLLEEVEQSSFHKRLSKMENG